MTRDFEQRPWGSWRVLDEGPGYKVKRVVVEAGGRLSYQTHERRSEHWVVVAGTATCVVDGETIVASRGEHVDVAVGQPHRLCNLEDEALVVIEVQRGDYTGEDDVVRLEGDHDRDRDGQDVARR